MTAVDYTLPLDELPDPLPIEPLTRPFDVTIRPPGSKSITCRAYVLAALAKGESKIIRPLRAEDTDGLLDALCILGAQARWEGEDVFITGVNGRFPRGGTVNLGDGGTPTRFMIAVACLAAEPVVVDGSKRMRERPIAEGVDMLRQLGAKIEYVEEEGRLPVRVTPSDDVQGGEITIGKTTSSQFVSALMLIGSSLPAEFKITTNEGLTSGSYVYLTMQVLDEWGIRCSIAEEREGSARSIWVGRSHPRARSYVVEPDASSAAYWIVAAAVTDSQVVVPELSFDSQQADVYVAKRLQPQVWDWRSGEQLGQDVMWPIPDARLRSGSFDASLFPDGALALAVAMACAGDASVITGLHTLRVKETDRIAALANELTKVGCEVQTTDDSITITPIPAEHRRDACATGISDSCGRDARAPQSSGTGVPPVNPVVIETYNDHRMAMAFAVLGLAHPGISIRNPKVVAKSYPGFWKDFALLYTNPRSSEKQKADESR